MARGGIEPGSNSWEERVLTIALSEPRFWEKLHLAGIYMPHSTHTKLRAHHSLLHSFFAFYLKCGRKVSKIRLLAARSVK